MKTFTAFAGHRLLGTGDEATVAAIVAEAADRGEVRLLIFEDETGSQVELDLRRKPPGLTGTATPPESPRGRGRPKLGVTAREVTLLPRHWDWLAQQPGGASATLRRLVEDASRAARSGSRDKRERTYRVMSALAGDLPDFEEASRALFASDREKLDTLISAWPTDVTAYVRHLFSFD